ncbi:MAG: hypothetical protein JKP90_07795 [Desulfofustis sp. PB-SRB1]|jgi:hypothetical protein|nr:hypothetical protein [Desulfofustis sp. PB-SRB1]
MRIHIYHKGLFSFTVLVFFFIFSSTNLFAFSDFYSDYIKDLNEDKTPIFVSKCRALNAEYKAAIFFKIGANEGYLFESKNNTVINVINFSMVNNSISLHDPPGGIWSRNHAYVLLDEILEKPFTLVRSIDENKLNMIDSVCCCSSLSE